MNDKENLFAILVTHAKRYPLLAPGDAVKLIFQNEFGGGHFVSDAASALAYLYQEYAGLTRRNDELLIEDIGNGYVRLHLRALNTEMVSLEAVNRPLCSRRRSGRATWPVF